MEHTPVLLQEAVEALKPKTGQTLLDATIGGGGHSEALCRAMGGAGTIVGLDAERAAIERSRARLEGCGCTFLLEQTNFRHLEAALDKLGVKTIDGALFDLGLSSFALEESGRGFSFLKNEPLRMTFAEEGELTAETVVNEWQEENLAAVFRGFGEEKRAARAARAIVEARRRKRIATSGELAAIIERALGRRGKLHPATKIFQALRLAVNDELGALREALPKAFERLAIGGRLAVISFHSIEDRAVKGFFGEKTASAEGRLTAKKPQTASREEQKNNPRSRSAKLRVIEKIR